MGLLTTPLVPYLLDYGIFVHFPQWYHVNVLHILSLSMNSPNIFHMCHG